MTLKTIDSSDPNVHSRNIENVLHELITHMRQDLEKVNEPRFQALLETSAEVLGGLRTAFRDYSEGAEDVWRHKSAS
jgi:hypothetical protein